MASNIAPVPSFPERVGTTYERKISPAATGLRGPLRFEEGVATDTDVPRDFELAMFYPATVVDYWRGSQLLSINLGFGVTALA